MDKLNVLIAGSTGYIGTQLVKILCKHKNVKIKYLCGNTSVGKNISSYDKDLKKYKLPKIIKINYKLFKDVDVIFTSLPNGESQKIANKLLKKNIMIDLSADFRLTNAKIYNKYYGIKHISLNNLKKSIYGLTEINKKNLSKGKIIACPGCYPTSILLPLLNQIVSAKQLFATTSINADNSLMYIIIHETPLKSMFLLYFLSYLVGILYTIYS